MPKLPRASNVYNWSAVYQPLDSDCNYWKLLVTITELRRASFPFAFAHSEQNVTFVPKLLASFFSPLKLVSMLISVDLPPPPDFSNPDLYFRFPSFNHYSCTVYRSSSGNDILIFEFFSSNIDFNIALLPNYDSQWFRLLQKKDWLLNLLDHETWNRGQLTDLVTRILDLLGDRAHPLVLIRTSIPSSFSNTTFLYPLGSLGHCLIWPSAFSSPVPQPNSRLDEYADWGSFHAIFAYYPRKHCWFVSNVSLLFLVSLRSFAEACIFASPSSSNSTNHDYSSGLATCATVPFVWKSLPTAGGTDHPVNIPKWLLVSQEQMFARPTEG